MAKKTIKKIVNKAKKLVKTPVLPKKLTMLDKLPKNEIEHLELMLFFTERAIPNRGGLSLDQGMINQARRIKARIAELKKAV